MTFEAPLHASNVMLIDPVDGAVTRVRTRRNDRGEVERFSVKSGRVIPKA
jgi:large subunit ribosomal protein L24